jgi:hypothetical protein
LLVLSLQATVVTLLFNNIPFIMIAMLPVALTVLYALTTQVSAQNLVPVGGTFNVSLGQPPKNQTFFFNQLLDLSYTGAISQCAQNCTATQSILSQTQGDPVQLCNNQTVKAFMACEQCMFNGIIAANKPMPDPRAGSTPVIQGYLASCKERANVTELMFDTTVALKLALPPTWDGPTGIFVPNIGLVFTVGAGVFLGTSAIVLLSNM